MDKILRENCKWSLTLNGKQVDLGEGLDTNLDSFLLNNLDQILVDKNKGTVKFLSVSEEIKEKIDNITADITSNQIIIDKPNHGAPFEGGEDLDKIKVIPGSIGTTRAITTLNLHNGDVCVPPMDMAEYKRTTIAELNDPNISSSKTTPTGLKVEEFMQKKGVSAENVLDMEEASWPKLTELGTEVHSIMEKVFKGEAPVNKTLPDNVFNSVVEQATKFKKHLMTLYPECTFYPELAIKSKNLSSIAQTILEGAHLDSFNGIIDLLVVDKFGKGHIYDYKVSRKSIAPEGENTLEWWQITGNKAVQEKKLWVSTKKLAASYQTEMYRNMVEQYDIPVSDTNILPIKLNLKYENQDDPFEVTGVDSIQVNYTAEDIITNPGRLKGGEVASTVKTWFKPKVELTADDIQKIAKANDAFFPKNSVIARGEDLRTKVEYYKKQDRLVHKLTSGEPKYEEGKVKYRISLFGQPKTYCEESELDTKLQELISQQGSLQTTKRLDVAAAIKSIQQGDPISVLTSLFRDDTKNFVEETFRPYLQESWTFQEDEAANSIGLFRFTKGNKSALIWLSFDALRMQLSDFDFKKEKGIPKLWKGNSLLGRTRSDMEAGQRVLPALAGNVEMMKAMSYVALHPELFKNYKISEIKVVNPWLGIEMPALNSDLIYNFDALVEENPTCGLTKVDPTLFMSDAESLIESAKETDENVCQVIENGGKGNNDDYASVEWFKNRINLIEQKYHINPFSGRGYQNIPIWNAYVKLREGLNSLLGYTVKTELDRPDYFEKGRIYELNGLMISSPQLSSSANIRELGRVIDDYAKEVRKQVYEIGRDVQIKFQKLYETHGTGESVFRTWFADREKLILKNPDSSDFDGDPIAREALDAFLKTMAKLRHPELKTEEDFAKAKLMDDYYAIPLLEAKFSRQVKNLGLWQTTKNKWKENLTLTEGLFMGVEPTEHSISGYVATKQELYNKLKFDNLAARQSRLDEYGYGLFETDLELVMNASLVAFCRSNVSKTYVPIIAGLKTTLEMLDAKGSTVSTVDMANIRKRFDDIVKSKFYGESIIPEPVQQVAKFLDVFKSGFSKVNLALNVKSFLRETLQGTITGLTRAGVKLYPGITWDSYKKAVEYVTQTAHKNTSGVSMLQQLNAIYGMANQSLNQVANQRRLNWLHINHWGMDTLMLGTTSPDFLHRMSLLVAKMMGEGSWEAHSVDENGTLQYDIKKDARFKHLVKGDKSSPEYLKELSLYQKMIEDLNREGFRKADGSKYSLTEVENLPQAYTRQEAEGIKNYADYLYGHYDEESKSLLCNTFIGSLFLQYKTFLTAKLEQWTMHEGKYNIATLNQQYDKNGKPLYIRFYEDDNGIAHKDIILESEFNALSKEEKEKCRLYFDYDQMPFQGMLQASLKFAKAVLTWNQEDINKMWSNPTTRAMLKLCFNDMWVTLFMLMIVNTIFGQSADVENPGVNWEKVRLAMRDKGPMENLAYAVLTGAMQDSQLNNILGQFGQDPPLISNAQRLIKSTTNLMFGKSSTAYWVTQNVGMFRDFQGIAKTLND